MNITIENRGRCEGTVCAGTPMPRPHVARSAVVARPVGPESPYDFLGNRLVYILMSARSRGLAVGVNLSPTGYCNFDCAYCEVRRDPAAMLAPVDVERLAVELERTLRYAQSPQLAKHPVLGGWPPEFRALRHVAISGLGEPTVCPNFLEAIQAIVHLRAAAKVPFFKLFLVTNGTHLDAEPVQTALRYLDAQDEIWIKLDAGTQAYLKEVNRTSFPLAKLWDNILLVSRQRPVVIQSLFAAYAGKGPNREEITAYARSLRDLKKAGSRISLVQVYSAVRSPCNAECAHLPLKTLGGIAQRVRTIARLPVEVF